MAITIRAARRDDYAQWKPLWDGYNAFYDRQGPTALDPATTHATWERFHDEREPVRALVAEEGGQLLGIAHYLFHRSTTAIPLICYLQDLFTAPQSRGRGIGRALIEAVYDKAREAGAPRVYWQTHEGNATARRLYDEVAERSGFIVYRKMLG